jgi:hypothetical protein
MRVYGPSCSSGSLCMSVVCCEVQLSALHNHISPYIHKYEQQIDVDSGRQHAAHRARLAGSVGRVHTVMVLLVGHISRNITP